MNLIKKFFSSEKFDNLVKLHNIENKENFKINNVVFHKSISNHLSNISIKFQIANRLISISGDIDFYKDNLKFFENSDLCFFNSANLKEMEILEFKKRYKIKKLIVLHNYRNLNIDYENVISGKDLMEFEL